MLSGHVGGGGGGGGGVLISSDYPPTCISDSIDHGFNPPQSRHRPGQLLLVIALLLIQLLFQLTDPLSSQLVSLAIVRNYNLEV